MTRAALFDIDGTLLDSVDLHARAWQEAFARFGVNVPYEEIRAQIGKGGDQIVPHFLTPEQDGKFGEQLDRFRSELFRRKYLPQVRPFPKVRELFEALRARGVRIALASSAKGDELERYIELARIGDLIEASTSSDDAERSKPHPDIFAAALERLGNPPVEETVAVGDSPYDAEGAGRLGIRTIGLLCGGFPEDWLRAAGCAQIFRDPADLLEHLDESLLGRSSR
jgi:HAD superfamily hydrolase (TIGR01509 family)